MYRFLEFQINLRQFYSVIPVGEIVTKELIALENILNEPASFHGFPESR